MLDQIPLTKAIFIRWILLLRRVPCTPGTCIQAVPSSFRLLPLGSSGESSFLGWAFFPACCFYSVSSGLSWRGSAFCSIFSVLSLKVNSELDLATFLPWFSGAWPGCKRTKSGRDVHSKGHTREGSLLFWNPFGIWCRLGKELHFGGGWTSWHLCSARTGRSRCWLSSWRWFQSWFQLGGWYLVLGVV